MTLIDAVVESDRTGRKKEGLRESFLYFIVWLTSTFYVRIDDKNRKVFLSTMLKEVPFYLKVQFKYFGFVQVWDTISEQEGIFCFELSREVASP